MSCSRLHAAFSERTLSGSDLFFMEDGGYTTLGMVVALLVSISLMFAGAQVYRINTQSAAIQDVADVAALAAENQVGQFMVVVRVCDAIVLSLSLTSVAATGLGIAAMCTPVTAEASSSLLEAGRNIENARNSFSRTATKTLDALQRALPFLAAASAWNVAKRNNDTAGTSNYVALAVLVPSTGTVEGLGENAEAKEVEDAADEKADDIKEDASNAEEQASGVSEAKHRGFMADCGENPGYCMYERAATLADMPEGENPLYASENDWTFAVALRRAQHYYVARFENEAPEDQSVEEQARSALRSNVYRYACNLLAGGYVEETDSSFSAYFPTLPRNTEEMRGTTLYDEAVYPVTIDDEGRKMMHAYAGCPQASDGYSSLDSVRDLEEGDFETCPECGFTATKLGEVCSASTSISNGFEYHYRIVAEAAEDYQKARETLDSASNEVKQEAESLFDLLKKALLSAKEARISAEPAGKYGVIVLVVDLSQSSVSDGASGAFITTDATLGTRAAVSGATLLADASDDENSIITQVLDGVRDDGGAAVGALSWVLGCWSYFLNAYCNGQEAITSGVEQVINQNEFASASGLGTWAAKKLTEVFEDTGLQAAELDSLKPVIVNTGYVAEEDGGGFSVRYLTAKRVTEAALGNDQLFSPMVSEVESKILSTLLDESGEIELATIQPLGDWGPSIPLTITLPSETQEASASIVEQIADGIRSVLPRVGGEDSWR